VRDGVAMLDFINLQPSVPIASLLCFLHIFMGAHK